MKLTLRQLRSLIREAIVEKLPDGPVKSEILRAVEEYLGEGPGNVSVCPDPGVPGTWAIRYLPPAGGKVVDFMLQDWKGRGPIDPMNLEEVEWKTWPPRSRH